jgi:hypothetical protein
VVKNVKIYAWRNATNNSRMLRAVHPAMTMTPIGPHLYAGSATWVTRVTKGIMAMSAASTRCPASILANKRTHNETGFTMDPATSKMSKKNHIKISTNLAPISGWGAKFQM